MAATAAPFASRMPWLRAAEGATAPTVSRMHFPQSVASGDPRPDRVLLWTRSPGAAGDAKVEPLVEFGLVVGDDLQVGGVALAADDADVPRVERA